MYKFAASVNARYYAIQKGNEITCGYEGENKWTKPFPYSKLSLICIANNGVMIAAADGQIMQIFADPSISPTLLKGLTAQELASKDTVITGLKINSSGTQLCLGLKQKISNFTDKVKFFFTKSEAKKKLIKHKLQFISLITDNFKDYYENTHSEIDSHKYFWTISNDFDWLAIAEPIKKLTGKYTKVSLVKVKEFTVYKEILLNNETALSRLDINSDGLILADIEDARGKGALIISPEESSVRIEKKPDWETVGLGTDFLAFKNQSNEIIIKTFDNYTKCYASFAALEEMNVPWSIHFLDKNNIHILTEENGELNLTRTTLDHLAIEAKRWTFIQARKAEVRNIEKEKQERHNERQELYNKKRKELAKGIALMKFNAAFSSQAATTNEEADSNESNEQRRDVFQIKRNKKINLSISENNENNEAVHLSESDLKTDGRTETTEEDRTEINELQEESAATNANNSYASIRALQIEAEEAAAPTEEQEAESPTAEKIRQEESLQSLRMKVRSRVASNLTPENMETLKKERQKIRQLLDILDERFIQGEITEQSYQELKTKYLKKRKILEKYLNNQ